MKMTLIALVLALAGCEGEEPPPPPKDPPAQVKPPPPADPPPEKGGEKPPAEEAAGAGDAARGEAIYKQHCVACHQADGKGMNGMLAADFTVGDRLKKSDEELLNSIENGVTGSSGVMPPWGAIIDAQGRADALAYIRATFGS